MDEFVQGNPTKQAVESLRGYAYQLYASALAWTTLSQNGLLYLEVAEDYATLAANRLNSVQVKATTASITLNSKAVIDTIDSFFDLKTRNPGKSLTIEYLTTASIGREAANKDLVSDMPGLLYWQEAAAGADVEPLRARLRQLPLKLAAQAFLNTASADELRSGLLERIYWRCGEPPLDDLKQSLLEFAVYRCDEKNEPTQFADTFATKIISRILDTVVSAPRPPLTKADLILLFDSVVKTSVPTVLLNRMLEGAFNDGSTKLVARSEPLEPVSQPLYQAVAREALVVAVHSSLESHGAAWLHAGTGYGKSTLAAISAAGSGSNWQVARLTNLDATATGAKIRRVATELTGSVSSDVILDDLGYVASPEVQGALQTLMAAARRSGTRVIITSHHVPTSIRLAQLGLDIEALVAVGDFAEQEVHDLVAMEGGDPNVFGRYAYVGSTAGHPQLAHALVLGLRQRGWPKEDVVNLAALSGTDSDIECLRQEIRIRLLGELPQDALNLLARLTLSIGPFSRQFAISLGGKKPPLSSPGNAFDRLIGPWIDTIALDTFRASSLVSRLGTDTFDPDVVVRLNAEIARLRISTAMIDVNVVEGALLNALIGQAEDILNAIFAATFSAPRSELPRIALACGVLLVHGVDRKIYPKAPEVSARLRALQVILLAAKRDEKKLAPTLVALEEELRDLPDQDYASILYLGVLTKLSIAQGTFDKLPGMVARIASLRHSSAVLRQVETNFEHAKGMPRTADDIVRSLFAFQITLIQNMESLFRMLDEMAELEPEDRRFFLTEVTSTPGDKAIAVRGPWRFALSNGGRDVAPMVSQYLELAAKARELGDFDVASAAYETAATISDEDVGDAERGLEVLAEAFEALPSHWWSIQRNRARILYRVGRYEEQLEITDALLTGTQKRDVEMAHLLREIAMGNSHLGRHEAASRYFEEAAGIAAEIEQPDFQLMSTGLLADAAMEAFYDRYGPRVIDLLDRSMSKLEEVDENAGLRQKALRASIPHTVATMLDRLRPEGPDPNFEYAMVPGLNSNPSPHPGIQGLTSGPLDFVWLLLSQLEGQLDAGSAISDRLRSSQWDERIPTLADYVFNEERLKLSFVRGDASLFCDAVHKVAAGRVWMNSLTFQINPHNSPRGRVPPLATSALTKRQRFLTSSALMFIGYQIFAGRYAIVPEFLELQTSFTPPALAPEDVEQFRAERITRPDNDNESNAMGVVYSAAVNQCPLSADDLFMIVIRLIGMRAADASGKIMEMAYQWAMAQWENAVQSQRFRLRSPNAALETIEALKKLGRSGTRGLAELTLAMRQHVAIPLDGELVSMLQGLR
ncbi:tetratricopeptide repeat protein [Ciceribacter thiooxidans]|uniref:Tetratricopeptide repeat protein n=1 Tax=Ciceribacter thiooxidans TaxID=1969821 RepID=A0ABV7I8I9_9HYPH|nr:tetratricopeptide repeat protein [Ciceribacter thiooxidans]